MPLRADGAGGYSVGDTRVPLDTVIGRYLDGATPEEIVRYFDVLNLADVHAVISYYLRHRERVHAYLDARRQEHDDLRRDLEHEFPASDAVERLRALKRQK